MFERTYIKRYSKAVATTIALSVSTMAHAASCPCDFSAMPEATWQSEILEQEFDKISVNSGVLCDQITYKSSNTAGQFSIFRRFVAVKNGKKSETLAEVTVKAASSGRLCLVQVENTGEFDSTLNLKQDHPSMATEQFTACIAAAEQYALGLGLACKKKER